VGKPRLPIDRVFSIAGFGTVVTGTLIDGRLQVGDEVFVLPEDIKTRIRGLQSHNAPVKTGLPGSRLAMNLSGVSTDQLKRGDVITNPGCFSSTFMADARLQILSDTPAPLRHNMELEFFSGSAHIPARIRILGVPEIAAGESAWVQLCFAKPAVLAQSDRFILRQFSPGITLGGGFIVESHPQRRHRRFHSDVLNRLETLAEGNPEEILLQTLRNKEPVEATFLVESSGISTSDAEHALERLRSRQRIEAFGSGKRYLISSEGWHALLDRISKLLAEYHSNYPLRAGMPREELKSRLRMDSRPFAETIKQASACGRIVQSESSVRLPDHAVKLSAAQQALFDQLSELFRRNRYSPPTIREARAMIGPELLTVFLERVALVKVSEDFFFLKDAYEEIVNKMIAHMKNSGPLSVAAVRDMFGMTRKFILPFLEHLDTRRITKRIGDDRVLL
jgi:selenocysteine-specific elongation factor